MRQVAPLTRAEERALFQIVQRGGAAAQEARDRIVLANIRWVYKVARGFRGRGLPYEDLASEGLLGLFEAIDRFDLAFGTRFTTYATWWIRQAIQRALQRDAGVVRVSCNSPQELARWESAERRLACALGRAPAEEEIAQVLDLRPRDVERLRRARNARVTVPLTLEDEESGRRPLERVAHERRGEAMTPEDAAAQQELRSYVEVLIFRSLDPREFYILQMRFGLGPYLPHTLAEVAREFGVSKERIRQKQAAALAKLRHLIAARSA